MTTPDPKALRALVAGREHDVTAFVTMPSGQIAALLDRLEAAERERDAPCLACRIREENGG